MIPAASVLDGHVSPGLVSKVLWLAAPATVAGIIHMFVVKRGLAATLAVPLDGGRSFRGRPLFGNNKTWRGVVVIIAATALLGGIQGALLGASAERLGLACVDYRVAALGLGSGDLVALAIGYFVVNAAIGAACVVGELPNSFLKRQLDVAPGARPSGPSRVLFFALDQCDSTACAVVVCAVAFSLRWRDVAPATATLAALHATIAALLYAARVKRAM